MPKKSHHNSRASSSASGRKASTRNPQLNKVTLPDPRLCGCSGDRSAPIVFKKTDGDRTHHRFLNLTQLSWTDRRDAGSPSSHPPSPQKKFANHPPCEPWAPRLRSKQTARRFRKMSGRRNASRSRLQSANPAKVRRHANRTAAIAPHTARGKPRRNRRRLSPARSARRPRKVPGIVCSSI